DAVIFLNYPPAVLNVLASLILWIIEEARRNVRAFHADAAEQECSQRVTPLIGQVGLRHAQAILRLLDLSFVVNRRVGEFMFEETAVVVPLFFAVRENRILTRLCVFCQQSEIEPLDWRCAFGRKFFADS